MTSTDHSVRAQLDAWRERGDDRRDPVRFHLIEALERRAANYDGETRALLDARIATLVQAWRNDFEHAQPAPQEAPSVTLGALLAHVKANTAKRADPRVPDPALLDYFRETWSRVRTERQLRDSRDQVPRNAGPLNSSSLAHRSLALMRELSPGYLQKFLSYMDTLSWLEAMNGGGVLPVKEAPRAAGTKKTTRARSR